MKDSLADWECEALQETKIMDVFVYKADGCNDTDEKMREVASHPAVSKAVKGFVDSIPDGQKVTISATGCKDVVIDKTHDHEKVQDDA